MSYEDEESHVRVRIRVLDPSEPHVHVKVALEVARCIDPERMPCVEAEIEPLRPPSAQFHLPPQVEEPKDALEGAATGTRAGPALLEGRRLVYSGEPDSAEQCRLAVLEETERVVNAAEDADRSKMEHLSVTIYYSPPRWLGEVRERPTAQDAYDHIKDLLLRHYKANGLEPRFRVISNATFTRIWYVCALRGRKVKVTIRSPFEGIIGMANLAPASLEEIDLYAELTARANALFMDRQALTTYGPRLKQTLNLYRPDVPYGSFKFTNPAEHKEIWALDFNKQYTSMLLEFQGLPTVPFGAEFEYFDGEVQKDRLYMVRVSKRHPIYCKQVTLVFGCTLIKLRERCPKSRDLLHPYAQLQLHFVPCEDLKALVREVYETDEQGRPAGKYKNLQEALKKSAFNVAIGKTGTQCNKQEDATLFSSKEDAQRFQAMAGGSLHDVWDDTWTHTDPRVLEPAMEPTEGDLLCVIEDQVDKTFELHGVTCPGTESDDDDVSVLDGSHGDSESSSEPPFWMVGRRRVTELLDGFLLINMYVKDCARRQMFEAHESLEADGFEILGDKTDCIYVVRPPEPPRRKSYKEYYPSLKAMLFEGLGGAKLEYDKLPPTAPVHFQRTMDPRWLGGWEQETTDHWVWNDVTCEFRKRRLVF